MPRTDLSAVGPRTGVHPPGLGWSISHAVADTRVEDRHRAGIASGSGVPVDGCSGVRVPRRRVSVAVAATVAAPPQILWDLLVDVEGWPRWNDAVTGVDSPGPLAAGTRFRWRAGGVPITSTVVIHEPVRRLGWTGRAPGIRAFHSWELQPAAGGTRVVSREDWWGPLPRIAPRRSRRMLRAALTDGLGALMGAVPCDPAAVPGRVGSQPTALPTEGGRGR